MEFQTADRLRDFLALCLDPPGREGRTVDQLAQVMPAWVVEDLREHAPELGALRDELTEAEAVVTERRAAFTAALGAWIRGEAPGA
ncbi:hypothetical protein B0E38_04746 [Streptomyces sp. 111WW2]|uniref:hypothetical protein n=1 Tax=Streptomyces sp. 111WW2 TaxID=1945515 RepID=UPI000D0C88A0|nr:hypothetical protein [Streptomyces sp. 111WW2]PSK52420.1 hypothetical protein B0E38_04746 [Streptomyces sp. 111WW2]